MTVNKRIKERREDLNPNVKGDKAVNVKTDEKDAADVPSTKQKDISPKKKEEESRDPSE